MRPKFLNDTKKSPLSNAVSEEQFEFDTSNSEARSYLQHEKASERFSLVMDPTQKECNDVFARGLRLPTMREHSVKELTVNNYSVKGVRSLRGFSKGSRL